MDTHILLQHPVHLLKPQNRPVAASFLPEKATGRSSDSSSSSLCLLGLGRGVPHRQDHFSSRPGCLWLKIFSTQKAHRQISQNSISCGEVPGRAIDEKLTQYRAGLRNVWPSMDGCKVDGAYPLLIGEYLLRRRDSLMRREVV